MKPEQVIMQFDEFLHKRGLKFEAVVIGGAALALLGVISRETQDIDVLDPNIPKEISDAAKEFGKHLIQEGHDIKINWLNNGPASLRDILLPKWKLKIKQIFKGKALIFHTLGRMDLLNTKLFAYCDRGQDLQDCLDLRPTKDELKSVSQWIKKQDAHQGWPDHVEKSLKELGKKLGYGI